MITSDHFETAPFRYTKRNRAEARFGFEDRDSPLICHIIDKLLANPLITIAADGNNHTGLHQKLILTDPLRHCQIDDVAPVAKHKTGLGKHRLILSFVSTASSVRINRLPHSIVSTN